MTVSDSVLVDQSWTALVRACSHVSWKLDLELHRDHGLPLSCFYALRQVAEVPATMSDLRRGMGMSPAGVTRVVRHLREGGLVTQQRSDNDRRLLRVHATADGHERLAGADMAYQRALERHFGDLVGRSELELINTVFARFDFEKP